MKKIRRYVPELGVVYCNSSRKTKRISYVRATLIVCLWIGMMGFIISEKGGEIIMNLIGLV